MILYGALWDILKMKNILKHILVVWYTAQDNIEECICIHFWMKTHCLDYRILLLQWVHLLSACWSSSVSTKAPVVHSTCHISKPKYYIFELMMNGNESGGHIRSDMVLTIHLNYTKHYFLYIYELIFSN